jgi:hypothetical protein
VSCFTYCFVVKIEFSFYSSTRLDILDILAETPATPVSPIARSTRFIVGAVGLVTIPGPPLACYGGAALGAGGPLPRGGAGAPAPLAGLAGALL